MQKMNEEAGRSVWIYFILTFTLSWLQWLPFVLWGFNMIQLSAPLASLMTPAVMLGAFCPMISAVFLVQKKNGWIGVKRFFRNALSFQIKKTYIILAILLPLIVTALAHYLVNFSGIDILPPNLFPENLSVPVIVLIIPYILFILVAGGGQEEFGWRGYAQEPLQERFGILGGSAVLGIAWGVWHLPLWFMPGEGHAYYSFLAFMIFVISMSISIGWLYNASGKKMVIPLLFHTFSNVSVPFFPIMHMEDVPQPGYWIWAIINVILALCLTIIYRNKLKSDSTKPLNQ